MTLPETLTPEQELAELDREIGRERRALEMSLRAGTDGRVCDRDRWLDGLVRRRRRIAELEAEHASCLALVAA